MFMAGDERLARAASAELGVAASTQSSSFTSNTKTVGTTQHRQGRSILFSLIQWLEAAGVVLATVFSMWLCGKLFSQHDAIAQKQSALAAVLVFFLFSQSSDVASSGLRGLVVQRYRAYVPPLIVAALMQVAVLLWLGWPLAISAQVCSLWLFTAVCGLAVVDGFSYYTIKQFGVEQRLMQNFAIIGHDEYAFRLSERLESACCQGIKMIGVFGASAEISNPKNGYLCDLISLSNSIRVDGIVIALPPGTNKDQIAEIVWALRCVPADVLVIPYLIHDPDMLLPIDTIGSMPFVVLQRRALDQWQAICKRCFDFTIALVAMLPFLIIFVIVAIAIKLDSPGPILFCQPRRGLNKRPFTVFKFRSMHADVADLLAVKQTSCNDPRITRVGTWLRKLSLDELPQLINVLRGEMSLVGPRPHAMQTRVEGELLDDALVEYVMRYRVKPGITGLAQINGARGQLVKSDDLRRRLAYDLEYITRWSIRFDLKILFLTIVREIISKHAY